MPGDQHCRRVDTIELKLEIEMRLGRQKTEQYFDLLNRYFSLKISKSDFDKLCIRLLGRESLILHNRLIRAIMRNAHVSKSPPLKYGKGNVKVPKRYQWYGRDLTATPRNCKSRDQSCPLRPHGKPHTVASECTELLSSGSRPPVEVTSGEEGEEIEQLAKSPGIHTLKAPFGVSFNAKGRRGILSCGSSETCYSNGELPDTSSLRNRMEQKLEMGGLNVSADCANLLNNGLDIFMKRLLERCLNLASLRSDNKVYTEARSLADGMRLLTYVQDSSSRLFPVSMTDFHFTIDSNPQILGEDWPALLEKVFFRM